MSERSTSLALKAISSPVANGLRLQRKCACGTHAPSGGECAECSKKKLGMQTKLQMGQPGDAYEQEADRVADRVAIMPTRQGPGDAIPRIQRFSGQPNEHAGVAPANVEQTLASPGRPLEPALLAYMEPRFGHDFSAVRVHDDTQAEASAQAMRAQAYTAGNHIVFNAGRYKPDTMAGRHLLAHELTHVVQQGAAARHPTTILRQPAVEDPKDECRIRNARAYIYFEIPRRFKDPTGSDPAVLKRARCLKKAFGLLDFRAALEFAEQIMQRKMIFADYMRLHHATRLDIAKILAERLNRKDTATYEARLLTGEAALPPATKEQPAPQLSVTKISGGITVSLDKPVLAVGLATLWGREDCEKYTFGFTQFVTEEDRVAEYYFPDLGSYFVSNAGASVARYLPCYDVFKKNDVWSYSQKLDCSSKGLKKDFGSKDLVFQDTPVTPFADPGDPKLIPSTFRWREKFVTVFYATLPNDAVHFFSWFDWTISYCKAFPHTADARKSIAVLPADQTSRSVEIHDLHEGRPAAALASMAGKPAPRNCNDLAQTTKALQYQWPISSVKCS